MATLVHTAIVDITWNAIASSCENGKATDLLSVGDIITTNLKNNMQVEIAVAGINTYKENEVIFTFKDILPLKHCMNKENTNAGGYDASDMAKYLDTEVFALLPDDLQAVIKERRGHKLWLHSGYEIFGANDVFYEGTINDLHLPYYQNKKNCRKQQNGEFANWWLSSANRNQYSASKDSDFWVVGHYCNTMSYEASALFGIVPGFCI